MSTRIGLIDANQIRAIKAAPCNEVGLSESHELVDLRIQFKPDVYAMNLERAGLFSPCRLDFAPRDLSNHRRRGAVCPRVRK